MLLPPPLVLVIVVIDAVGDVLTTLVGFTLGMPERNRIPLWVFKKFGNRKGPAIYLPFEILALYLVVSIAYNALIPAWGSSIAGSIVVDIAAVLAAILIGNNVIRIFLKWRKTRRQWEGYRTH